MVRAHQSQVTWQRITGSNSGMRAVAFNDVFLLTCLSNDCSYENVFGKSVEMFAISSSGKSENILNGVRATRKMGAHVVTLSGFKPDNPLRSMGDCNFIVQDEEYGPVEIIHLSITHCILMLLLI